MARRSVGQTAASLEMVVIHCTRGVDEVGSGLVLQADRRGLLWAWSQEPVGGTVGMNFYSFSCKPPRYPRSSALLTITQLIAEFNIHHPENCFKETDFLAFLELIE